MKDRIENNGNWFIVEIIESCEPVSSDQTRDLRRLQVHGNYILINAENAKRAYEKAEKIGRENEYEFENTDNVKMKWKFEGISQVLPIYDDIQNGNELFYCDYGQISSRRAKKIVTNKKEILENIKPYKS